jgi:hypothetical protein
LFELFLIDFQASYEDEKRIGHSSFDIKFLIICLIWSVEITLDNSVKGCLRSFNIKDLGVQKSSKNSDDKITFTPTKKGTFKFACVMGMGYGNIIVE